MSQYLKDIWQKLSADLVKAHKSLTIWFNSVMGMVVVGLPLAQDSLPQLQDYLPGNVYHYLMGALVVGNIVLRFKTNSALAQK